MTPQITTTGPFPPARTGLGLAARTRLSAVPTRPAQPVSQPLAYPVPWVFDRSDAPRYRLVNASMQTLWGVSFTVLGSGMMAATPPLLIEAGGFTFLHIRGDDLARDTILLVRWFTPEKVEYLWRVAF